jgi:hypothetical protein
MTVDDLIEAELTLNRFRRLIHEVARGDVRRTVFQPWEIDILVDLQNCQTDPKRRGDLLRQYEGAVTRQMESGQGPPMKFSEFLQSRRTRRPSSL